MRIQDNVSLAHYSTMGLGGIAAHLTTIETRMELLEALSWAQTNTLPVLMIGGGSNIIWRDEGFAGLVIVNAVQHYETFNEDDENIYVTAGAGELWDTVVERTAQAGLTGIEALSLIPGNVGAVPVQNVGAYGQEVSQTVTTIEAFDTTVGDFITIPGSDCNFAYRSSRFNTVDRGRFYIMAVTFHLTKAKPLPPYYGAVQTYFSDHGISDVTPQLLRDAVIDTRRKRLPDPALVHNSGSFFGNPIISIEDLVRIHAGYPAMPSWSLNDNYVKIPAAWLIEQSGFKNTHDDATGMATWPQQPLVLINEHAQHTADLLTFKQSIVDAVHAKFGITLKQEPEFLPTIT